MDGHTIKCPCAFLFGSSGSIVAIVAGTTVSLKDHVLSAGTNWGESRVSLRVLDLAAGEFGTPQRRK